MAIEIVSFPIKHGDFPVRYVKLPEGMFLHSSRLKSLFFAVAWPVSGAHQVRSSEAQLMKALPGLVN